MSAPCVNLMKYSPWKPRFSETRPWIRPRAPHDDQVMSLKQIHAEVGKLAGATAETETRTNKSTSGGLSKEIRSASEEVLERRRHREVEVKRKEEEAASLREVEATMKKEEAESELRKKMEQEAREKSMMVIISPESAKVVAFVQEARR
ncbi:hypothetical protein BDZ89DRAFT_1036641 [Hymenopellis radicata]|nr:hypothetical protein BDZ89DRAFT_1036641 [Hymenopellis radicata]